MLPAEIPLRPEPRHADACVQFTLELGAALHRYGMPAHRIEGAMQAISLRLGREGRFYSTPTSIIASFGPVGELNTAMVRLPPGDMDLEKLVELDALADAVIDGRRTPDEGAIEVARIQAEPERYGQLATLAAYFFAAFGAAPLFGGGLREAVVAGLASLLAGLLEVAARRFAPLSRVWVPISAMVAAALSAVAASFFGPLSPQVATLAGLIVLLPGLSLTVALTELATRNLISGTSRLTGAGLVFLQLCFGVALGARVSDWLPKAAPAHPIPLAWWHGPALALSALALSVWLRARPRDMGWIALVGGCGYGGVCAARGHFGPELAAFFGAVLVAALSNLVARFRNKPAMVTIVPALLLLVPGSIGFRSLEALLARDVLGGVGTGFSTVLAGVALCAGLLFGNAIVPPRRVL